MSEWGIHCIYGSFGSWKTLFATATMIDKLKAWEMVFSNVMLDTKKIPNPKNYYYFESMADFMDILTFTWEFASAVNRHNEKARSWVDKSILPFSRNRRASFNIFFEERAAFANAKD